LRMSKHNPFKRIHGRALSFVDVYGPRLIATVWMGLVRRPRLLTYIRLSEAARYIVAASPDGFPRASPSMAPRHGRWPCRSTNQVREATVRVFSPSLAKLLQCCCRSSAVSPVLRSGRRRRPRGTIVFSARQHRPHDPCVFVGERDGDDVWMPSFPHATDPLTSGVILATRLAKNSSRAMDHQRAQVAIAAFADPRKPSFSTA